MSSINISRGLLVAKTATTKIKYDINKADKHFYVTDIPSIFII